MRRTLPPLLCFALLAASCGDDSLPPLPDNPATTLGLDANRPASIFVPTDYDPDTEYPLVMLLHGFAFNGAFQDIYFGLSRRATSEQMIVVIPDGTPNSEDARFWNATPNCCNFEDQDVDDVGYLRGLIEEAGANYRVDPGRVYLLGHSNGGYMSYRMACDASDVITAIVSLAGSTFEDPADCAATTPVSVLQIHGTADAVITYEPELTSDGTGHPGAVETARRFAERAGCDTTAPTEGAALDLEPNLDGAETTVLQYRAGCRGGVDADLWTIVDGGHIPGVSDTFMPNVLEWMMRHSQ